MPTSSRWPTCCPTESSRSSRTSSAGSSALRGGAFLRAASFHTSRVERDWKRVFEDTFEGPPSTVERRVWREVFGDDYPTGLDPYSFITQPELERFAAEVGVGPGDTLIDLGCG